MADYDSVETEIRSRLRELRKADEVSIETIAKAMGRSKPAVYAFENGNTKDLTFRGLWFYARALRRQVKLALVPEDRDWELLEVPRRLLPLVTILAEAPEPRRSRMHKITSRLATLSDDDLALFEVMMDRFDFKG